MQVGKSGATENTPKNIPFGAGTIHKNLAFTAYTYTATSDEAINASKTYYTQSGTEGAYTYAVVSSPALASIATYYERSGGWNFTDSLMGATSGGSKFSIVPELVDVLIDGVTVATKGLKDKVGEKATMEVNFAELTKDIIKQSTLGADGTSEDSSYDAIVSKSGIATGDYLTNIAFVGKTLEGKNIIVIMENALCTSGLENEGKNKENAVGKYTYECHAALTGDATDKLPWKIYYPKAS